jgi:hypothetical protein
MGNYATVAEVKAFKVDGSVVDLTGYTDAEIEVEIGLAEDIIEGICNDIFYEKDEVLRFDGNGLTRLFFKPLVTYKLLSINSVKEYDLDGTTVLYDYVENEDYKRYDFYIETAREYWDELYSPRKRSQFNFGYDFVWPKGQKNIVVDGTWGNEEIPPAIKRATILLTLEKLIPGSAGLSTPSDVTQASWSDFTISFSTGGNDYGDTTGYPEIDRLLYKHINWINLFNAIPAQKETYDRPDQ